MWPYFRNQIIQSYKKEKEKAEYKGIKIGLAWDILAVAREGWR